MLLSVCLIARNEERFLAECLQSVQSVADEIILVDTGSTDGTPEIARKMGCRVFTIPWTEDFAAARNYALDQAQGEWILSIDADERLQNPDELRRTLESASPEIGGFLVRCYSPAQHGGTAVTLLLRLFRRHERIRFRGRIHEQVSVAEAGYRIAPSSVCLWHEGYAQGADILRAKHERNLRLLELALAEEPQNAYLWLQYARSAIVLGELANAAEALERAWQLCAVESPLRFHIRCWQAQVALLRQRPQEALLHCRQVLQRYPNQSFALSLAAEAYVQLQQWHQAAALYEQWHRTQAHQSVESLLIGSLELSPAEYAFRLGRCYYMVGRWDEAEQLLRSGAEQEPEHELCAVMLTRLLLSRGRLEEADALLARLRQQGARREWLQQLEEHRSRRLRARQRSRPLLSLSMIVRNEAERLPACLDSVRDVVDEIVIVDTGSEDSTLDIARRYGARVFTVKWSDDFAAARNEALRHCSGEWILYLDADERLHPTSARILRDFLCDLPESIGGIVCTIVSPHRRENGSREIHRGAYPRIFRNYGYPTIRFEGRVHEQISPSLLALGKQIVASPLCIEHLGYDQPPEVLQQKVMRNYRLLMRHVQEEPLNAYSWFQLGQTLARMHLLREAEDALRFALQIGTLSPSVAASAALVLAQLSIVQGRFTDGLGWAEYALHHVPNHTYALLLKAQALRLLGEHAMAAAALQQLEALVGSAELFPTDAAVHIEVPPEAIQREWQLLQQASTHVATAAAKPLSG